MKSMKKILDTAITAIANAAGSRWNILGTAIATCVWYTTSFAYTQGGNAAFTAVLSILALLICYVIQYTQNKDTRAIHEKLDELIRTKRNADSTLIGIEKCDEDTREQREKEEQ